MASTSFRGVRALALVAVLLAGCGASKGFVTPQAPAIGGEAHVGCRAGEPLTVRFYDAGQALAALVELPDGRRILVDAGESPKRAGCKACRAWHERMMAGLSRDIPGRHIDMLWITHQHSDHIGGAAFVFEAFHVTTYVDNGLDLEKSTIREARKAARERQVSIHVVDPQNRQVPLADSDNVKLRAIVPDAWPRSCRKTANDCSIGLRIDYCRSSMLFVGDAEAPLEAAIDVGEPVTLLQVGHHGSDTSTTEAFVAKVQPKYAVVSSAKRDEGTNLRYCHPRQGTVERLTRVTGGPGSSRVMAFDGRAKCKPENAASWSHVPTSDRMWFTARDGDVVLETRGDGEMRRVGE